jgi:hypothetical protein
LCRRHTGRNDKKQTNRKEQAASALMRAKHERSPVKTGIMEKSLSAGTAESEQKVARPEK